jgi:hypothetical protein
MEKLFKDYISSVICLTFDFIPEVKVVVENAGVLKVFLDGTEDQRKQMMGHDSLTFQALKRLLVCFSKQHNVYVYLYIVFPHEKNIIEY